MGGLAQVCIFNLIASSLHFAPRLKSPLTPLFALDLFFFFNMTRISPACVLSRRHKPCSRQPCVLTVDFESELRICRLCFLFILKSGCKRLRERHTVLLVVVTYLSSLRFCVPSHCNQNVPVGSISLPLGPVWNC